MVYWFFARASFGPLTEARLAQESLRRRFTEMERQLEEKTARLDRAIEQLEREVSERRRAEQELRQAQQKLREVYGGLGRVQSSAALLENLAALGNLVAVVSHEVLNPLNILVMGLDRLKASPELHPSLAEEVRLLSQQAGWLARVTQDILSFARFRPLERQVVDLNETVRQTLRLMESDLRREGIEVDLRLAHDLPPIRADQNQLQQVILNLLTNARDVLPGGGRIVLRTAEARPLFSNEGRVVELRVEDTGPGIPRELADKLFEPFFTTKPKGKGTGLGLSISQRIVEAHGGLIWAENLPEGGAAFTVRLYVDGES
jgi:signal transduction histidine kinase